MSNNQYTINQQRIDVLNSLRSKLSQAKARIKILEDKIEKSGINAGFSINEDLLQTSQRIWMYSNELAMLKKLNKLETHESWQKKREDKRISKEEAYVYCWDDNNVRLYVYNSTEEWQSYS